MESARVIDRRQALRLTAGLGAGAMALSSLPLLSGCTRSGGRRRPNILFIFSDDHACHAISAYGSKINQTPNIDRIAREGSLFRNSFCSNGICAPSRAVILTGKHSHINGKIDNANMFDMSQPTFNKMMQEAGYQTAMIGKWHLRADPEGFDFWNVLPGQGAYYNPDFRTPDGTVRHTGYVTDIITDLTLDWLKEGRDTKKPFMLMCQHKAPHRSWMPGPDHLEMFEGETIPEPDNLLDDYTGRAGPAGRQEMTLSEHAYPAYDLKITPPSQDRAGDQNMWRNIDSRFTEEQRTRWNDVYGPRNKEFRQMDLSGDDLVRYYYQRYIKDYLRCIASVDDNIGRLLDWLDESGLADDTMVIYSSDQGFFLGDHGWYDKRWMYEESLRMPFVARWPGVIREGTTVDYMIQNIDYAPTFLDAAGIDIPADMQGESLLPLMEGRRERNWRESIYYHYYEFPAVHMVARHYGVRTGRYKLIYYYYPDDRYLNEWELFDLENDPREMNSVYDNPAYADIREDLKVELRRLRVYYNDETGDDFQ
ncbi:sulfatase [Candidatus Zixiibacteriota bacterium]